MSGSHGVTRHHLLGLLLSSARRLRPPPSPMLLVHPCSEQARGPHELSRTSSHSCLTLLGPEEG